MWPSALIRREQWVIMIKHRVDIGARRDQLAAEGWSRFDDQAEKHG